MFGQTLGACSCSVLSDYLSEKGRTGGQVQMPSTEPNQTKRAQYYLQNISLKYMLNIQHIRILKQCVVMVRSSSARCIAATSENHHCEAESGAKPN